MTQEQLEGNILIAEFMEYIFLPEGTINGIKGILVHKDKMSMHLDGTKQFHAKYHSSWDWIMPACYKWDNLFFDVALEYHLAQQYELRCDALDNAVSQYKIIPVFNQLAENIKWYNKNK